MTSNMFRKNYDRHLEERKGYSASNPPKVGDRVQTWFSDSEDGMSEILEVRPYVGKFSNHYKWVVKVTAPHTRRGWMELSL